MTTISNLPDEILFMICENLNNVVDIVNISTCSKRLNFICKNSNITNSDVYTLITRNISITKMVNLCINFNKSIKLKLAIHDSKITDVSMLGKVYTLNLSWCHDLTDVSKLGNVHTLDLSMCEGIKDSSDVMLLNFSTSKVYFFLASSSSC